MSHTETQRQASHQVDRSTFLPDPTSWLDTTQGDLEPAPSYLRVTNCGRVVDCAGVEQ